MSQEQFDEALKSGFRC